MMLQLIDKKIFFYILIFFLFGTINNKDFKELKFNNISQIKLFGLDVDDKDELLKNLQKFKSNNIFNLNKNEIQNLINKNKTIEDFNIFKKYPSEIIIKVKKTKFLANLNIDGNYYLIGSNKKLISTDSMDMKLPIIFGKPSIHDFFQLYENIFFSNLEFTDLEKLFFFPSKRWDLKFKNGNILKLPLTSSADIFNIYLKISKYKEFRKNEVFDMRIMNQLIIKNEL